AVSDARSLPGSLVPAQEGLPQGRGRYPSRRGGAGAPCRGAWEVGADSGMTVEFGCAMMAARKKRSGGAPMSSYETLKVAIGEDRVGIVTMNRPDARNA